MVLALDMLSVGASGRRSYAWGVGSGFTEAHTDFWQSLRETTWLTTQCCFRRHVCHSTCEDSEPLPRENRQNAQSALHSRQACSTGQLTKTIPSSEWLLSKKLSWLCDRILTKPSSVWVDKTALVAHSWDANCVSNSGPLDPRVSILQSASEMSA